MILFGQSEQVKPGEFSHFPDLDKIGVSKDGEDTVPNEMLSGFVMENSRAPQTRKDEKGKSRTQTETGII